MSDPTEIVSKLLDESASVIGLIFATWAFQRLQKARRDINAAFKKIRSEPVAPTPPVAGLPHDPSGVELHVGEVIVRISVATTAPTAAGPSAPTEADQDREPEPATAA